MNAEPFERSPEVMQGAGLDPRNGPLKKGSRVSRRRWGERFERNLGEDRFTDLRARRAMTSSPPCTANSGTSTLLAATRS